MSCRELLYYAYPLHLDVVKNVTFFSSLQQFIVQHRKMMRFKQVFGDFKNEQADDHLLVR